MIVILTALAIEQDAVLEHLVDVHSHEHSSGTIFEVGTIVGHPRHRVAVGITGPGTTTAAALTERAKAEFSPSAMMFVGVAGGLREWLKIGDVVVATKIYSYQGGRSEGDEFLVRPRAWDASHRIDQAARRLSRRDAWHEFLPEDARDSEPAVHFDPIAVADVVLNSTTSDLARRLRQSYNDAVAVEMEGSGFAHAAALSDQLPAVVVRGISDHADGTKEITDGEGGQRVAARNVAAFAVALAAALKPVDDPEPEAPASSTPASQVIHNRNIARDNAHVGNQVGVNFGALSPRGKRQ
ncbi:5'-methylthioadenosine/S-adenosylhomocysteine nucleosidase [Solihabitans fulvus]|uniref:5'-methylthioadenosine/S-adenosylhomocysteine nucleosidase n=1 Tax=Solihabitans fulvus TaxID=1892852 RepID=A0A5B2XIA9_9PSEU|nr:5'-methylthioadenosine/S-adenosylhomocysteine nucleosidase [Solihabitans fulvus]KAA2262729.1 5'-methylthioadenosine/S-adenosylhomocysteine nucleosidase [Solihabitans fulvus]